MGLIGSFREPIMLWICIKGELPKAAFCRGRHQRQHRWCDRRRHISGNPKHGSPHGVVDVTVRQQSAGSEVRPGAASGALAAGVYD